MQKIFFESANNDKNTSACKTFNLRCTITSAQKGFSWSSVAVSVIAAPIASKINDSLFGKGAPLSNWANKISERG